ISMNLTSHLLTPAKAFSVICAIALGAIALTNIAASAAPTETSPTAATTTQQKQFTTPKEAADSLIAAAESFDVSALKEILGPEGEDLVSSSDPVMDKN